LKVGCWLVVDVRLPSYKRALPKGSEVDYDLGEGEDEGTGFTTGYRQHGQNGRVIRKWNKTERYVDDILVETDILIIVSGCMMKPNY
jgi:hypothetical protein